MYENNRIAFLMGLSLGILIAHPPSELTGRQP
jgi:hypothetical protein